MKKWTTAQHTAINLNEGDAVVSASAGSGKTSVMIERALKKIMEGTPVNRLLIVTFTRSASADMRQKLQKALIDALDTALKQNEQDLAKFLRSQITLLPTANITTLSSFCHTLVRRYFFEAEIGTDIEILEDAQAKSLAFEIIGQMLEQSYNEGNWDFMEAVELLSQNREDGYIKEKVFDIYECARKEADVDAWYERAVNIYNDATPLIRYFTKKVDEAFKQYVEELKAQKPVALSLGFTTTGKLIDSLLRIVGDEGLSAEIESSHDEVEFCKNNVFPIINKLNTLMDKRIKLLDVSEASKPKEFALMLIDFTRRFGERFMQRKLQLNLLQHNDLEHLAHRILLKYGKTIAGGFDFVFVDEYQDISPLQDNIIALLCNNNSFFVGDIKQSIYGFRLCKPQIFLDKFVQLRKKSAQAILLNHNFRSKQSILEFCNAVFDGLMTESFGQVNYSADAKLEPGLSAQKEDCSSVCCLLITKQPTAPKALTPVYSVLNEDTSVADNPEAILVAQKIKELLEQRFFDGSVVRNYRYSDFAILLRARTDMAQFYDALLAEEIPAEYEKQRTTLHETASEIAVLLDLLKLIDNFRQDIPLLTVLKSDIFGFTDDDIFCVRRSAIDAEFLHESALRLCAGDGTLQNDITAQPIVSRLTRLFDALKRWHEMSLYKNVPDLLSEIIKETDYFGHIIKQKNGAIKTANLENWLNNIASDSHPKSLPLFLQRIKSEPTTSKKSVLNEGSNTVKIMTIHQSKGLEFPVVFLCGTNKRLKLSNEDKLAGIVIDSDFGLGVKLIHDGNKQKSFVSDALLIKQHEREREEELRLLYVALTRAQQQLFIVASNVDEFKLDEANPKNQEASFYLHWIKNGFSHADVQFVEPPEPTRPLASELALNAVGNEDFEAELKRYTQFSYPHPVFYELKTTVTKLNTENEIVKVDKDFYALDDGLALMRGNAYHKLMEALDFCATDFDKEFLRAITACNLSKEEIAQIDCNKIRRLHENQFFQAHKNKKLLREKKFILNSSHNNKEPLLVQGVVDLIILDDDGAIVLDYKTTRGSAEYLRELYRTQLMLYKQAVERILGIKVKASLLYSFYSDEIIEVF